jgi:hypothetical protein
LLQNVVRLSFGYRRPMKACCPLGPVTTRSEHRTQRRSMSTRPNSAPVLLNESLQSVVCMSTAFNDITELNSYPTENTLIFNIKTRIARRTQQYAVRGAYCRENCSGLASASRSRAPRFVCLSRVTVRLKKTTIRRNERCNVKVPAGAPCKRKCGPVDSTLRTTGTEQSVWSH